MTLLLEGKTAIITGGNAGIGKAIAERFAKEGANIIILATNQERGEATVLHLQSLNPSIKAKFFKVNVSLTKEVDATVADILKEFPSIDILINNAGIVRDTLLMKMSEDDWDTVLNVNLKSVYNTCHALVRNFIKARKGKIINITSVVGLTGNAGQANYAASKSGMIGFTKSLAKELATRGINVNCIAPGFIETEMTDALNDEQKKAILSQVPMNRLGSSDEIASAALFLASDLANYITGQTLTVDGGMVM
jgi:3-oxoacyl-[acyl-carrier protein] reductase